LSYAIVYSIPTEELKKIVAFLIKDLEIKSDELDDTDMIMLLQTKPRQVALILALAVTFGISNFDRIRKIKLSGTIGKNGFITDLKEYKEFDGIV